MKKSTNKLFLIQIILLISYIVLLSCSQSGLYYDKNYIREVNQEYHISSFDLSHSKCYLIQNDRSTNAHSSSFIYNNSICWILMSASLILFICQKLYAKHYNKNPGLKKRLKIILSPQNHRSKYKAYLAVC